MLGQMKPLPLGGGFLRWAHHPHCDRYSNHLLWIGEHPFCLGCTCMYSGMLSGVILTTFLEWSTVQFEGWVALHLILLLPTIIQPWFQNKTFKIISRFTLGFNIASYFVSGLLLISPPFSVWLFRALVVIMFLIGQRLIKHIRNHYTYNPCSDCPLGSFPTCEWNLPRLLEANPEFGMFLKTDD
jgi:uncharacterized membrane protein